MIRQARTWTFGACVLAIGLLAGLLTSLVGVQPVAAATSPSVQVSNNSRQTIHVPVAPGLKPSRISGSVTAPVALNGNRLASGTVVVWAGGQVVYRGKAGAANFNARLTDPEVSEGVMEVSVRYTVKRLRTNFCSSNLQQVGLTIGSVSYTGTQTQPETVSEFLQPGISGVNVVLPTDPNQGQIEAGLAALGAAVYRLGSTIDARLSVGKTDTRITRQPGARVIKFESGTGTPSTMVGEEQGVPTLTIAGRSNTLTEAAAALGGNKMVLANSSSVTNLSQTFRPTVNLNQPFAQLGAPRPNFKGWGSQVVDFTASQSQFGGSLSDMRVRLVGATTQIPEGAKANLNVYWNQSLIGSVDLASSPSIDSEIAVPNSQLEPNNSVRVELATLPPGGKCTGSEATTPIGVSLDPERSQVRASRGQTQSPGFARFPQSFNGSLPVSFGQSRPSTSTIESAGLLVAALQRENVPQMAITVVPFTQVDGGTESTLVLDADDQVSTKLGAPLTLNSVREVHSPDLEFKVKVPEPYSALEAFSSGTRNIVMLGGWAAKDEPDATVEASSLALAENVYSRSGGWSSLSGDIMITEPSGAPQTFNSNAVVPQPPVTQVDRTAFWWMIGVILVFVGLGAWRYLHVRNRREVS